MVYVLPSTLLCFLFLFLSYIQLFKLCFYVLCIYVCAF